ncbi:hypothetical protein AGMMS49525_04840 [Bacteroidia bacterium]|nr:hypothetical protein AGMMS49525_04840 [Bacteroidia bacterium]
MIDFLNIAQKAHEMGIEKATIGFSTGKDSVVGMDLLIKAGIEPMPIYFYIVPNLQFIEDNLTMYENHFGVKIARMPHPILYDYINHQDWQPFDRALTIGSYNLGKSSFEELTKLYLTSKNFKGFDYDCNCMKMADSLNRRLLLRNLPDVDTKRKIIYLTKYFTDTMCFDYIKENNIPLTDDYKIFGRSWDGLNYHFLYGVKKFYPNDYELIKEMFPLIDAEIFRYKIVNKYKNEQE